MPRADTSDVFPASAISFAIECDGLCFYNPYMDYKLNNAEFILLLLIAEMSSVNGYQLRQTVTNRGMEAWAGVSASSIYVVLKKLENRGYVSSKDDTEKETKGARGQVYLISQKGETAVVKAIEQSLSQCREHDPRFNIALSGIEFLDRPDACASLKKRRSFLVSERERLKAVEARQPNLPMSATLLFDHVKFGVNQEISWLENAITKIAGKGSIHDTGT